ncbi:MAG: flagellar brake domain-containing protein [Gammaproteobacteria bacterium]|nr:flagellar brake domain-containing protein [Gammaproteobacteria bacterium]
MAHKPHIEPAQLDIEVGTHLQIQVGQFQGRMDSTLVGIRPGRYLIISMPADGAHSARLDEDGALLVARYIHNGNAYGFKSVVLDVMLGPEKLLAISYPTQFEVFELRNYPRLSCFLPARIFIGEEAVVGSIIDISRTGAQFNTSSNNSVQFAELVDSSLNLDVLLPGSDGYTHIGGNLRNVHATSKSVELGLRFDSFEMYQLSNLISFLLDAHAMPEYQNLSSIIDKHYSWREKVSSFIHAGEDVSQDFALSPDECDMGRWLSSEGKQQYAGTDELKELDRVHRELHRQVEAAIKLRVAGNRDGSIKFFNKIDIEHISHRLAALLITADENRINAEQSASLAVDTPSEEKG